MKLLWLDDIRNPFEDDWVKLYAPEYSERRDLIEWVKDYTSFTKWIVKNGLPDMICFDHDLGEDVAKERVSNGMSKRQARILKKETMSGYDCAKWLVEYCLKNKLDVPNWNIQSANTVGKENINNLLINYRKHYINI